MKTIATVLLLLSSMFCFAQNKKEENKITMVEVYGRVIDGYFPPPYRLVSKSSIKKKSTIYVKMTNEWAIEKSNLQALANTLILNKKPYKCEHFDALTIIHYSNKKKEKYYIAFGNAGIYKGKIQYEYSCEFIAAIYSFLPVYYFYYDDASTTNNYYKKPCSEVMDLSED